VAITRLTSFSGEAEVRGRLVKVEFADERLVLQHVSLEEAQSILDALAYGKVVGVNPHRALPRAEVKQEVMKEHLLTKQDLDAVSRLASAVKEELGHVDTGAPLPSPKPLVMPPQPADAELAKLLEFPPKDEAPAAVGAAPEKVVKAKRFIEVLNWVMSPGGFTAEGLKPTQVTEIVAACEALRKTVTVVDRVRDMHDKVVSNLAAFSEAGIA
jgi:hypothetical protein